MPGKDQMKLKSGCLLILLPNSDFQKATRKNVDFQIVTIEISPWLINLP
jgi:hypothetical protein